MSKISPKKLLFLFTLLISSDALAIDFDGKFVQGHFILGKTDPESQIWIDKKKVKVTDMGISFLVLEEIINMTLS